jgi:predicted nucleic acid-binding protein
VYLETSFFSACVWDRKGPKSVYKRLQSRQWWTHQRSKFELFVSAEVVRELSAPGFRHREEAIALVREAELVAIDDEVRGLAKVLVKEKVMPGPAASGDAIHVAAATVHRLDFLVTWNQRHIANRNKIVHLREVCRRVGCVPPELTTPDALWIFSEPEEL